MFWQRLTISQKLFAVIVSVMATVVLLMAVMVGLSMRSGFSQYLADAELERFTRLAAVLGQRYDPDNPGWKDLTSSRRTWNGFVREVLPRPGRLAQNGAPTPRQGRPHPPGPPRDPLQLGQRLVVLGATGNILIGNPYNVDIVARRPITYMGADNSEQTVGWVALTAAANRHQAVDAIFLRRQYQTLLIVSIMAILLSVVAAWFLSRQFLRPVRTLAAASKILAKGDFTLRLENDRVDELGDLVKNFNELAENLEEAKRVEIQWISDTSHELKTPLAVLRSQVEALQDGVRQPGAELYASLHNSVMRLAHLVDDLNTLSQSREGVLAVQRCDEDLVLILKEAVDAVTPRLEKGVQIETNLEQQSEIIISCDRFRLRQLVDNLLENSRRYTSSPGVVAVEFVMRSNGVEFTIEDSTPAPPVNAMGKLFDRFYRAEESRSREYGGSGLGLSICHAIASAHGGKIDATASGLGGLKVTVTLPNYDGAFDNSGKQRV